MVLFSYKSSPPGFSSTSKQIGPRVLGQTEVFQTFCSRSNIEPNYRQVDQGFWVSGLLPVPGRWHEFLLCVVNRRARGTQVRVWCPLAGRPASQPATKSSHHRLQVSPPPKKLPFCPPLGSTVAVLKHIFCALPEEVWIKVAVSHSSTCPDLYYPSEVFAKEKRKS